MKKYIFTLYLFSVYILALTGVVFAGNYQIKSGDSITLPSGFDGISDGNVMNAVDRKSRIMVTLSSSPSVDEKSDRGRIQYIQHFNKLAQKFDTTFKAEKPLKVKSGKYLPFYQRSEKYLPGNGVKVYTVTYTYFLPDKLTVLSISCPSTDFKTRKRIIDAIVKSYKDN